MFEDLDGHIREPMHLVPNQSTQVKSYARKFSK